MSVVSVDKSINPPRCSWTDRSSGRRPRSRRATSSICFSTVRYIEASLLCPRQLGRLTGRVAYHPQLGVAAFPRDATVVLVQYDGDSASDEVIETAKEETALHPSAANEKETRPDAFRYVAWSSAGSSAPVALKQDACVAIATAERVEVWRVSVHEYAGSCPQETWTTHLTVVVRLDPYRLCSSGRSARAVSVAFAGTHPRRLCSSTTMSQWIYFA
jgi:hypothetical protein